MNKIKLALKKILPKILILKIRDYSNFFRNIVVFYINFFDKLNMMNPLRKRLQGQLQSNFKVAFAVLIHERPEYLKLCLESLFKTNLYDYDITFFLVDDGSKNPEVAKLMKRNRGEGYKIKLFHTQKGHNSWGAAFNKAMNIILKDGHYDLIGSCDSDAVFHPEWLKHTMDVCLWAKKNHKDHILGPFSSFNSSDFLFHKILGEYSSPFGNYVVKERMGALNYFYFTEDFKKLGFFTESRDDETLMTKNFKKFRVRNFCLSTSYIDHIGDFSILNEWRPVPVKNSVCGINLAQSGWGIDLEYLCNRSVNFYKFSKKPITIGENVKSNLKLDIFIPVIDRDLPILSFVVEGVRKNLMHPIGKVFIVSPDSSKIKKFCGFSNCEWVNEESVEVIKKSEINYVVDGVDRSGWLYQQFLKLNFNALTAEENFLVLDSDTIFTKPQVFERGGKILFLHSDEYHAPYFSTITRLLPGLRFLNCSFVSHQMLFSNHHLNDFKKDLELHSGKKWFEAILDCIDKNEGSSFSEYETYGQWLFNKKRESILREYWFNGSFSRTQNVEKIIKENKKNYRSMSFHYYM